LGENAGCPHSEKVELGVPHRLKNVPLLTENWGGENPSPNSLANQKAAVPKRTRGTTPPQKKKWGRISPRPPAKLREKPPFLSAEPNAAALS